MDQKQLFNFLNELSENIEEDKKTLFKRIIGSSEIQNYNDYEEFFFGILYPFDKFIEGCIRNKVKDNNDVVFIIKNSQFVKRHFQELFQQYEGFTCCADKAGNMISQLINYYKTGDKIVFDYDEKYTFHLPQKIFKKHDDIILFYKGLKALWYGRGVPYLSALKTVLPKQLSKTVTKHNHPVLVPR